MDQLNELEISVLKQIKKGRTEFLFQDDVKPKGILEAIFFLQSFGFINATPISTKDGTGYTNVELTQKGKSVEI